MTVAELIASLQRHKPDELIGVAVGPEDPIHTHVTWMADDVWWDQSPGDGPDHVVIGASKMEGQS